MKKMLMVLVALITLGMASNVLAVNNVKEMVELWNDPDIKKFAIDEAIDRHNSMTDEGHTEEECVLIFGKVEHHVWHLAEEYQILIMFGTFLERINEGKKFINYKFN